MTRDSVLDLRETISALPPLGIDTDQGLKSVRQRLEDTRCRVPILVVLDDDPTGTQTCHDINVLTLWDEATLAEEFRQTRHGGGFFILTNSRALHPPEAKKLMHEICTNLKSAAKKVQVEFEIVSRSDSTLRGHFPLEPWAAEDVLGEADAWILCPFFLQGGRYTIEDVHYVAEGEKLVPAAETPFAKDASFGYKSSNLSEWVVEKSKGSISLDRVKSLSISSIREGGADVVKNQIMSYPIGSIIVVNAAAIEDIDIVVLALLKAAGEGKTFVYRTGAAFVSSRLGIARIDPITAEQLSMFPDVGGLIIAGSYVPKTTAQLAHLRKECGEKLASIVLDVQDLLASTEKRETKIKEATATAEKEISRGRDVLVMTSREVVAGSDERESLDIGSTIAKALVSFLVDLKTRPRYIIAKVRVHPKAHVNC